MKKQNLLIFICLAFLNTCNCKLFAQQTIQLKLKNNIYKQAFFCSVKGEKLNVIAINKFEDEIIKFQFTQHIPVGIYKIFMADSLFLDIIIDKDSNIVMETSLLSKVDSMKVIKGSDNKTYYQYLQYKNIFENKLKEATSNISQKIQPNPKKSNSQLEERINFIKGYLSYELEQFTKSLISKDSTLFVSKLIKAMNIPNVNIYLLKHPDSKTYRNDAEFLLSHFFDNIDFLDSSFLNTDIYYRTIKFYIEKLVLPRNVTGFNYANEYILNKAAQNKIIYYYIIELLIALYENTQLEEVYVKLFTDYLSNNPTAVNKEKFDLIANRVNIFNNLKPGTLAPDISGKDSLGKEIKISDIKSDMTLLFIWTSYSKHAEETIKQLSELYTKYKDDGFKIISVSLDTNEVQWKTALKNSKPKWTNIINTQGLNGPISKSYNVWALPRLYLIDKKQILLAKPMNVDYLKKQLEAFYKKK